VTPVGATFAEQALALAEIQTAGGSADAKKWLAAWDRLGARLSALDSKTSVLLRFNAIVVAALAYVTIIKGVDPLMGPSTMMVSLAGWIGHLSLAVAAASCGFAFPVINVEWRRPPMLDDAAVHRLGAMVARRTFLYSWAWRLAVLGGVGFAVLVALALFH
jgi:hypothetical protein